MATEGDAKPTVYVDTTVVSYLTARRSRDIVTAAHQQVTREWWPTARSRFNLVVSDLVIEEAGAGDPSASRARLAALEGTEIIRATAESRSLTEQVLATSALPRRAAPDAAHVAMAATNGVDYLVTWNLRHMAGAPARAAIEQACRRAGYRPPIICTPEQLPEIEEWPPTRTPSSKKSGPSGPSSSRSTGARSKASSST